MKPTYRVVVLTDSGAWSQTSNGNLTLVQALERAKYELKRGHTAVMIQIFNVRSLIVEAGGWDD